MKFESCNWLHSIDIQITNNYLFNLGRYCNGKLIRLLCDTIEMPRKTSENKQIVVYTPKFRERHLKLRALSSREEVTKGAQT